MARCVTLVLLDADGAPVGALPPFDVGVPWWMEVGEIQQAVRARYGLDTHVLRLLGGRGGPPGGDVTYLAQAHGPVQAPTTPMEVDLSDDPRRAPYARPGGPTSTLAWARSVIEECGRGPVLAIEQLRTWNLSAIWRLSTSDGPLWIKEVPSFFAHEPAVLEWLAGSGRPEHFPELLAHDGGRMLLEHITGEDLYDAPAAVRDVIAGDFHPTQLAAASAVVDLLHAGVPDRRFPALAPALADVADGARRTDAALERLIAGLDRRLAAAAACGLPDTLVHGDLHPGNVLGRPGGTNVILDWGDSFVGSPAFDILRLTERLPDADVGPLVAAWAARWRADVPGCDPERAVHLLRPVAPLRLARVYVDFLRDIEPSEHPYHADDPARCLSQAAQLAAAESAA